ncbi:hypothetical protein A45J_2391 [hot springs metagenome]|uniref:Amine oxidase domain-containing protein n=1 Tax=hot springs metagenome TaxID=433727 RepID=A0A5J4L7C2_9ZZZZ
MGDKKEVVILGAGIGGLAAGYFLSRTGKYKVTILEKEPVIGGLCGSFKHDGFTLDYGAHKIYSVIPGILDEIVNLMGDRLLKLPKRNRLFLNRHLVDYPLRLGNLSQTLGPAMFFRLGMGYAFELFKGVLNRNDAGSYEEYIIRRFGRPAYKLVFEPLADKVWGNPSSLHLEMARTRVPSSGGLEVILKLLGIKKETAETSAESFYYPRNGFGDFPNALKEQIERMDGKIITNAKVTEIRKEDEKISSVICSIHGEHRSFPCDLLISSIPIEELGRLVFRDEDSEFNHAVGSLQFRHLILIYIFVNRPLILSDQWIFFPERQFIFSRIFEQKQMNPDLCPPDKTAICCDFTCSEDSWQWQTSNEELTKKCVEGLVEGGFIKAEEVIGHLVKRRKNFYPRYDLQYEDKMQVVINKLKQVENLLLTGRIGMYNYNNADHCMDMGRFISEKLVVGISCHQIIEEMEKHVRDYRIVD